MSAERNLIENRSLLLTFPDGELLGGRAGVQQQLLVGRG